MDLIKVYADNKLVMVSDDYMQIYRTFTNIICSGKSASMKKCSKVSARDAGDIDVIVNDPDKEYGYSLIYPKDDGYGVDLWQTRLDITEDGFAKWFDDLSNGGKCYYSNDDLAQCIEAHFDFWNTEMCHELPSVFILTDEEVSCLLKNGFKSAHIFLSVIKYNVVKGKGVYNENDKRNLR